VVIGPPDLKKFRGRHVRAQPCIPWFFGGDGSFLGHSRQLDFDDLCALSFPDKKYPVSVVCSNRSGTTQYDRRLAFVRALKEELGEDLHWFGRGFRPVGDKSEAIIPYRYHIVLENNTIPHFWTEKLADAFLGDAFPIVAGGSHFDDYFPSDSFEYVDLENIEAAVAKVVALVRKDVWAERYPAIRTARERLLYEHNIFAVCANYIAENTKPDSSCLSKPAKIKPLYSPGYRRFRVQRKHVRHWLRRTFPYGIF
jgi:hypothetical protein